MHQRILICVFSLCLCAFVSLCSYAEIIDKIVAVVDGHIITLSDMRQHREIRARLGEKPIDDDKTLVQQMIEDRLIETQIAEFPGVDVTDDEISAGLARTAARSGPASDALREAVRRRIRMARYFDVRFRQFLRASDEEIKKYYDEIFVPEAKARGLNPVPALGEVTETIRENIIEEKLSHEVSIWLEAIRRRSDIEIFD